MIDQPTPDDWRSAPAGEPTPEPAHDAGPHSTGHDRTASIS
jgi:hypothetical protein